MRFEDDVDVCNDAADVFSCIVVVFEIDDESGTEIVDVDDEGGRMIDDEVSYEPEGKRGIVDVWMGELGREWVIVGRGVSTSIDGIIVFCSNVEFWAKIDVWNDVDESGIEEWVIDEMFSDATDVLGCIDDNESTDNDVVILLRRDGTRDAFLDWFLDVWFDVFRLELIDDWFDDRCDTRDAILFLVCTRVGLGDDSGSESGPWFNDDERMFDRRFWIGIGGLTFRDDMFFYVFMMNIIEMNSMIIVLVEINEDIDEWNLFMYKTEIK